MDAQQAVDRATALLRARGDRMTGPRRAVLAALSARRTHLTADQVVSAVAEQDPTVHRASVYRTLETLTELGVVQHVHVGHGTTTYHLAGDEPHLHAQCEECGAVIDLPGSVLDDVAVEVRRRYGFVLDPSHVALSGTCGACLARRSPPHPDLSRS
jgi:Fur family transcriptional regulator, ferric uptake regulator